MIPQKSLQARIYANVNPVSESVFLSSKCVQREELQLHYKRQP